MEKIPKLIQADKRGQIVIPKEMREEMGIEKGANFWIYSIGEEGLLLKKVKTEKR